MSLRVMGNCRVGAWRENSHPGGKNSAATASGFRRPGALLLCECRSPVSETAWVSPSLNLPAIPWAVVESATRLPRGFMATMLLARWGGRGPSC
jgi:hypothetical protein